MVAVVLPVLAQNPVEKMVLPHFKLKPSLRIRAKNPVLTENRTSRSVTFQVDKEALLSKVVELKAKPSYRESCEFTAKLAKLLQVYDADVGA